MKAAAVTAILAALITRCWAQEPAPTLIRAESRLVLVDAVVTDKQGRPVSDVTAKDFRLWEDGREEAVESATFGGASASASYVVLLFDNPTLDVGAGKRMREAAAKFVEANAGPGHWVAVADFDGGLRTSQNFTGDTARVKRVLLETHPLPGSAATAARYNAGALGRPMGEIGQANRDVRGLGLALRALAINLANVPGRKMVVLFTASTLAAADASPFIPATEVLNRHNVSVYPVGAGEADLPVPFYELAKSTGGFVSANSHQIDQELERLRQEKDGYYTLSYVPRETPDGSCHTLRVKIDRAGAEVRARNLYCNVKAVDLLAGTPVEKELERRAAGDQAGNLTASLQLPFFYAEPDLAMVRLVMEVPSKALPFAKVKGKLHGELQILAIAWQKDGVEAARFSDTVKLDFGSQEEVDAFVKRPLHYEGQFEVASGVYSLKVALSTGGENFGRLEQPLAIEPYDGKRVTLSGLALCRDVRPASDPGQAQLLEGVAPLLFQNLRFVPFGESWFHKGETAAIYGEVYEAMPRDGNPAPMELRLSVTDLATGKATPGGSMKLEAFRPGEFAVLPFALNLNSLPPGRYRAEVEAAGAAIRRWLEFEVR